MDLTINGTSLSSIGVIVETQTQFTKPKRRNQRSYADKVDGSISEFLGYDGYTLDYKITPTESEHFDELYALLDGDVILEASDDPDKFWYASVEDEIKYGAIALWKTTTIIFYVYNPFRYVKSESLQTITAFPATINNAGTAIAKPLLKITGSGVVNLTLNGVTFEYEFDTPYVYIDCESEEVYYGTASKTRNLKITGDEYMTLDVGDNILSINSGTVTEVVVTKRTRYV